MNMSHTTALPPFDICVHDSPTPVREALAKVLSGLGPLDLEQEEAGTVELVLAEALNNIVEHAYAQTGGNGPIKIRCVHKADGLHLQIDDEGNPMPGEATPLGLPQDLALATDDLPEGGFGWFMIHQLAKDVCYRRQGSGNQLNLRLAIAMQYADC